MKESIVLFKLSTKGMLIFINLLVTVVAFMWMLNDFGHESVIALLVSLVPLIIRAGSKSETDKSHNIKLKGSNQGRVTATNLAGNASVTTTINDYSTTVINKSNKNALTIIVIIALAVYMLIAYISIEHSENIAVKISTPDETLIIVTDFENRGGLTGISFDAAQYIYERLLGQIGSDSLAIRVHRLRISVDDNSARAIREEYNASIVVWGWYDDLTITPKIEQNAISSDVCNTNTGMHFSFASDTETEYTIVRDVPDHSTGVVLYLIGHGLLRNGDYEAAIKYFTNSYQVLIQMDTRTGYIAEVLYYRGFAYLASSYSHEALEDFNEAICVSMDNPNLYSIRGICHSILGENEQAINDFTISISLDPTNSEAYTARGFTYLLEGNAEGALSDLSEAIRLNPLDVNALESRSSYYLINGEYDKALADLYSAIESDPTKASVFCNLGAVYGLMNEHWKAMIALNFAILFDPQYARAYYNKGRLQALEGDFTNSLMNMTIVISLNQNHLHAFYTRGRILFLTEHYEKAVHDLNQALEICYDISRVYGFMDSEIQANERLEYRSTIDEENYPCSTEEFQNHEGCRIYTLLGLSYTEMGLYEEAISSLDQAIHADSVNADAYFNRAIAYSKLGMHQEAILNYSSVIEIENNAYDAYVNMGLEYVRTGNYELAQNDYNYVINRSSDYFMAYYNRGALYEHQGRYIDAITDYERAISLTDEPTWLSIVGRKLEIVRSNLQPSHQSDACQ